MEERNAAVYVRISRDRAGAGLGVDRQEQDCRELAAQLGWTVVDVYPDNDLSAYSGKPRPQYRRMLADLKTGRVNAVVAWHTDRLHRKVAELEEFVTVCQDANAAVRTVRAGELDLSNASGLMVARMLAAAAQHEIDHARERMKRAKAQAADAGKYRGGPRPYGFEPDGLTVRLDEAARIREAAELLLSGRSLRAVTKHLNEAGALTSRGTAWKSNTLKAMLLRPRNVALVGRWPDATTEAAWPAVLPEDTWRAVGGLLTNPERRTNALNPGRERRWLGAGIYVCGKCQDKMRVTADSTGRRQYVCKASKHVSRDQGRLDDYTRAVMAERLRRPDLANLLPDKAQGDVLRTLTNEARALRLRATQAEDDYAQGVITGRQLQTASRHIAERLDAVDGQLASMQQGRGLGVVLAAADPAAAFRAADVETQAAVLMLLTESVTVEPALKGRPPGWQPGLPYFDPARIAIEWRGEA